MLNDYSKSSLCNQVIHLYLFIQLFIYLFIYLYLYIL